MVFVSCFYGSVRDSEFPALFKELILLSGNIVVDFNYLCQETIFTAQKEGEYGKLIFIRNLITHQDYIQKINPPEPWNRNEPNIICYSKSPISGNSLGLLKDLGYSSGQHLFKVGYSFTYFGIDVLLVKVCTRQDLVWKPLGNLWLVIVKSPEYSNSNDAQKYTATIKNITNLLKSIVEDLGSVDHSFLKL